MLKYTTVLHEVKDQLGLTMNEYCVVNSIYRLSANPRSKAAGWSAAKKQNLAEFLGVSRRTITTINFPNGRFRFFIIRAQRFGT